MNRFRYSNTLQNFAELSSAELRHVAPSIFAEAPIAGVSERYTFLPTASILDGMRKNGWVPVMASEQRVRVDARRGFQKHMLRFQRVDHVGTQLANRPEVILMNSHDKTSAYQLHAGIFRFVCGNGMVIADETFEHISIKHYGFTPDSVIEGSFRILDSVPALMDNVDSMRDLKLTEVERKAFAVGALALKWEDPATAPVRAEKLLEPRRYEDEGDDLYSTLNVVQENMIQGGQKDYSHRNPRTRKYFPRTRGIKGIDENVKVNKGLWAMAEYLKANR